jgi:hypothetical protein
VTKVKALGLTECFYEKKKDCYSFTPAKCECNPVMEKLPSDKTFDIGQYSYNAADFSENSFESICYLLDIYFSKKERAFIQDMRNFLVTKRELNVLFRDFMGC